MKQSGSGSFFFPSVYPPHSPAHLLWSTVLSTGWSVTCGVYVSVCLTVYSELILTHSIYLSYNRSTPTCPLESARACRRARLCVFFFFFKGVSARRKTHTHAQRAFITALGVDPICIFHAWFGRACSCCACDVIEQGASVCGPELPDRCSDALCAPVCSNDKCVN